MYIKAGQYVHLLYNHNNMQRKYKYINLTLLSADVKSTSTCKNYGDIMKKNAIKKYCQTFDTGRSFMLLPPAYACTNVK